MFLAFPNFGPSPNGTLPQHGFHRESVTTVFDTTHLPTNLRMNFRFTKESLQIFPFKFEVLIVVTVFDGGFEYDVYIRNLEDGEILMPFCPGLHPYFATPYGVGRVRSASESSWGTGGHLSHSEYLSARNNYSIEIPGSGIVQVEHEGLSERGELVIWRDHSSYLCVEPVLGDYRLFEKPDGLWLPPKTPLRFRSVYRFTPEWDRR